MSDSGGYAVVTDTQYFMVNFTVQTLDDGSDEYEVKFDSDFNHCVLIKNPKEARNIFNSLVTLYPDQKLYLVKFSRYENKILAKPYMAKPPFLTLRSDSVRKAFIFNPNSTVLYG